MPSYLMDEYHRETAAAYAPENARVGFIRRTYMHLACSVAALVAIEALLLQWVQTDGGRSFLAAWFSSKYSLLAVIAMFIAAGFLARYMARASMPTAVKYLGLALYTLVEAIFILPLLYVAMARYGMGIVNQAALLTLVTFGGLTLTVFITRANFSHLGPILCVASFAVFGVIVGGILFGFGLGLWISFVCIALAAGFILYDTSNIMRHYATNEHVSASLNLLADVVLLFWHILRILMLSRDD